MMAVHAVKVVVEYEEVYYVEGDSQEYALKNWMDGELVYTIDGQIQDVRYVGVVKEEP